jgi:eukaryotic-like serine/threonine-protein kinase
VTPETCIQCGGSHASGACPGVSRSFDSLALASSGDEAVLPTHTLPPGARVGEYQVTGLLGQGGMGVVYSGVHPLLGRKVAIKVLNHQLASAEAAARFLQEARAASRLRHQNIVDVFAFGQMADGHYYQVMELLEGESLRALLHRDGPLALAQARTVIVGVLGGLGAAHRAGIVHRDVKPDNIFLCAPIASLPASGVKILDFGLAKNDSAADASVKTRTGITMGTPAYMSPEQCRALHDIDARADIYAAGVVLFEMLAGHAPFQSESAFDVMTMQISVPAPRLGQATGRPEPLEPVIAQAMEKRPAARFDTAEEMLAAIDGALPLGVLADYATGGERRPPRQRPVGLAERPTLIAAGSVGGATATPVVATSTKEVWRSRRGPRLVAGAGIGFALIAAVLFARAGGFDRSTAPAAAVPAAPAAPAAPAPVVPPATQARAASAPAGAPPAPDGPAATATRPASDVTAGHARSHRRVPGGPRKPTAEPDLDSPLNPYAH